MAAATSPLRLAAAVLAAGEGRRLGGVCKALIRVDGTPQVVRLWRLLAEAGVGRGVVVTGAHAPALNEAAAAMGVPVGWRLVHHPDHAAGQPGSVRCALQALLAPETPAWDAAVLLPCDLPLLTAPDLRAVVDALDGGLVRPVYQGQPAHPVALTRAAAQAVLALGADADIRAYVQAQPQALQRIPVSHDRGSFDMDTPEDLAALRERTGWSVEV